MKKTGTLLVISLAAASMVLAGCGKKSPSLYTNRTWTEALGDDWNPHTWETSAESSMLGYLTEPFVGTAPLDTEKSSWQWTYRAAREVNDVTADHVDDLDKYGVKYTEKQLEEGGFVFEIKLNTNLQWEEREIRVNGVTKKYTKLLLMTTLNPQN